jgi:hypothetical protein
VPSPPMGIEFLPDGRLLVVDLVRRGLLRRERNDTMVTEADLGLCQIRPSRTALGTRRGSGRRCGGVARRRCSDSAGGAGRGRRSCPA